MIPLVLALIQTAGETGKPFQDGAGDLPELLKEYAALEPGKNLLEWLASVIQSVLRIVRVNKKALHPLVRLTIEQVNKKFSGDLSLKILAADFNVSPAYLGQLFKEETGKFFNDYVTQIRLRAARALLLETNLKIGELICRVGIPNQSYFNRMFKKAFGVSPVEFRRLQQHNS